MNGTKMSKSIFFQMIEKRLEDLTKEVETIKADTGLDLQQKLAKENILFGRVLELNAMNSMAMDVDFWKYSELDTRITTLRDKI